MFYQAFHDKFPAIAEKETRCISITNEEDGLPKGEYFLLDSYCNDPKCDCRRVFINVLYKDKILATIGYGWESLEFYENWMGEPAPDMKGPILELTGPHTEYSETILKLFKEVVLKDSAYIERIKTHYKMFKKKTDIAKEAKLEDFNPEEYTLTDLCGEVGTGIPFITDDIREPFYPLLMAIEETIWKQYSKDGSLKDTEVIESLKNIRDNIFSEGAKFNRLENNIIKRIKTVLFLNDYCQRDVSLSISAVLKSAKLHRSLAGRRKPGHENYVQHDE